MDQQQLEVRPARLADADRIFELLTRFAVSYPPVREAFDRDFPRLPVDDDAVLLAACLDGEVVGYVLAFRLLTLFAGGPIMEIEELMVDEAYRNRGAGRRIVSAVIDRAWESDCREVTVPTRRAGDYYAKLGFVETAAYFKRRRAG